MTLQTRLKTARAARGLKQKELADRSGVDQTTISRLENGKHAGSGHITQIARALGVDAHWLATGKGTMEPGTQDEGASYLVDSNVGPGPAVTGLAPEISWVQAGSWTEVCYVEQDPDAVSWHPRVAGGDKTFVLRVVGDSMLPDYPPGRLIFIDPERAPENGDDVIAVLTETDEATFKRLVEEPGSGRMLKAINPAWHQTYIPINGNCRIIGVVVADMRLR
ncbi:LexA family transcriptional regulator [uncultured Halomonas sp.]|uniref:helix-turn-helix domain-containing protein n=1 Tax=uncultured Halomonas sp. TaxID=173971 RepID=UPI00263910DE|nr:LexA family transcriptional regulator [uncultured Halomonas sp.]